jgi:hypothetical protein
MLTRASDASGSTPWTHECGDYVPKPGSPAYNSPGFSPINVSEIGVDRAAFPWRVESLLQRDAVKNKIQAERYAYCQHCLAVLPWMLLLLN